MYTSVIAHPTWLIRRDVFNRVGLYRDFYSCEDYDFYFVPEKEIKMGNVKDVLLKYRVNQFSISNSNKSYQRLVSNFLRKNYERVEDITKEDIVDYIDSNMGRKKNYQSIENYYEKREKSKLLQGKNELLSKINLLSYMFSKVAWDNLIASIMPNIYRRLYK